jgi:hypothetical protein
MKHFINSVNRDWFKGYFTALLVVAVFAVLFSCLGGCATLTDQERYEQANAEVLRLEAFDAYTAACEAWGGKVLIKRMTWAPRYCATRTCPPNRDDFVSCATL